MAVLARLRPRTGEAPADELPPLYQASPCPYCKFVAYSAQSEVDHMNAAHPDVIGSRLRGAGFRRVDGEWVDTLADPND